MWAVVYNTNVMFWNTNPNSVIEYRDRLYSEGVKNTSDILRKWDETSLKRIGIFTVYHDEKPTYDPRTQKVVASEPTYTPVGARVVITYTVQDLTQEEIDRLAVLAQERILHAEYSRFLNIIAATGNPDVAFWRIFKALINNDTTELTTLRQAIIDAQNP